MRRSTVESDAKAVKKWARRYCAGAPAHTVVHKWLGMTTRYSVARAEAIKRELARMGGLASGKSRRAEKKRKKKEAEEARQRKLF